MFKIFFSPFCPENSYFFLNLLILFTYFWLCWVFAAACGLSLVVVSRGYSSLRCAGFSMWWLLLLQSTGSRRTGFSSCGTWAQQLWLTGSRAQAQQLWHTGLVALQHAGSSQTRARTCVPPHWQVDSQSLHHQGSPENSYLHASDIGHDLKYKSTLKSLIFHMPMYLT